MKKFIATVVALAAGTICSPVAAAIVSFDTAPAAHTHLGSNVVVEGLRFQNTYWQGTYNAQPGASNGTNVWIAGYNGLTISKGDGSLFSLDTIDLGLTYYTPSVHMIGATLFFDGGGSSTTTLSLTQDFQTFDFGGTAIRSLFLGSLEGYLAVDNVAFDTTAAVPAPAALGLFGLGICGIAAMRRRKAA